MSLMVGSARIDENGKISGGNRETKQETKSQLSRTMSIQRDGFA